MATKSARNHILAFAMAYYGAIVLVSLLLPGTVRSFEWNDAVRSLETCLPAAAAYVALAVSFLRDPREVEVRSTHWSTLRLAVWGPMFLVVALVVVLFYRYIDTNSLNADSGDGMSPEFFHGSLAAFHGFIGGTTALVATWLFQPAGTPVSTTPASPVVPSPPQAERE